jgi:hypothetical protein
MRSRWDFFLAHAGNDAGVAESLYELLSPQCRVFLDSRSLKLGDDWDIALPDAQRRSLITVVIISPHTPKAYYQREEVATAIQLARTSPGDHRVVPVVLQGDAGQAVEIPYGLRLKHGVYLDTSNRLEDCAQRLLRLLAGRRSRTKRANVQPPSPLPTAAKRYSDTQRRAYAELWPAILELFDLPARNGAQVTFDDRKQGIKHHNELAEPGYALIRLLDQRAPFLDPMHYERLRQIATDFCNYQMDRRGEYADAACTDAGEWTPARGELWKTLFFDRRAEAEQIVRQVLTANA